MTEKKETPERETLLEFPCSFPVKIMGRDHPAFHDAARMIIDKHAGPVDDDAIRVTPSREGKFVSVTVVIEAVSQAQLDSIYEDLSAHDEVLVAL